MMNMGNTVYFLRAKDDVCTGMITKVNKTTVVVEYDGNERRIPIDSVYETEERAWKANEHFTKKEGRTEADPFWNLEDIYKISDGFAKREAYHWQCVFLIGLMIARRVGDIVTGKWSDYYDDNLQFRYALQIVEEKTGKYTNIPLPKFLDKVLEQYREKVGFKLTAENVHTYMFPHEGERPEAAYQAMFRKVRKDAGIPYNVSSHSVRKTFGLWTRKLHPNDPNVMLVLQRFFNHSDMQTTMRYIGLAKEAEKKYIDDMADMVERIVGGDTQFMIDNTPVQSFKVDDLRSLIQQAYQAGAQNNNSDVTVQINVLNNLYNVADRLAIEQTF